MVESFIQEHAVLQVKKWLETCRRDHPSCSKGARHADIFCTDNSHMISDISSDGLVPTRLLGFSLSPSSEDDDIVKVVPSDSLEANTNYIALSHRWGKGEHCKLVQSNYDELTSEGMKTADLPLTLRESIELCRGLGIPYLWIDSLNIIQDNREDWKHEARRMAVIYDRATLTIAATDGIDSNTGLHIPDPANAELATLNTRAWVCQEDMISPRTVAFTMGTVIWDCREAESELESTELRARPPESSDPVPRHPKDIFCFFRDWRLPRLVEDEKDDAHNKDAGPDPNSPPTEALAATSLNPSTQAPQHHGPTSTQSDQEVKTVQGPLSSEERAALAGQSYIEVVPDGPDGPGTIIMYYGDDLASHAAHLAEHQHVTGEHLSLATHPDDWDPATQEPFGNFTQIVTDLLRPEKDYDPFLKVWWQFITLYTGRELTYPSDRFLAINGVTRVAQRWTHMRSTFGLWYHFLVNELVWHVNPRTKAKRPSSWIAPSWTWASTLEGQVGNFYYRRLPVRPALMLKPVVGTPTGTSFDQVLPMEAWRRLKYRSVTLKGDLRHGLVMRQKDKEGEWGYNVILHKKTRLTTQDNERIAFYPDCEDEWPVDTDVPILSLLMHHYDGEKTGRPESRDICLALRRAKVDADETTSILDVPLNDMLTDDRNFMRVGYLEIVYPAATRKPWAKIVENIWWREVILV